MWETFPIQVGGGLIQSLPAIQQGLKHPGSAIELVNFEASTEGGYRRINGYTKWDTDAVPSSGQIWGVMFFDGDVIAARGSNVYESSGAGWTSIQGSRTQTTKQRGGIFNFDGTRKLVVTDGSNYPYTWDKTTFTVINGTADILGASHAVAFKDHMFYANDDLITFSEPFDETAFSSGNGAGSFRVPNKTTGMIVFRERLFIFTETETLVLDGSSSTDFAVTYVSDDIGCIAPDTIQEVGGVNSGDVMFLAKDGLRLLGATERIGDFSNVVASKPIQTGVSEIKDFYNSFSSVVIRDKSQYRLMGFLSGRDSASTRGVIGAQTMRAASEDNPEGFEWSYTQGIKAYSADSKVYLGDEHIIFCDESDYVYELDQGQNFDGTAIAARYWTPYLSINDPVLRKSLYTVKMFFSPEGDFSGSLNINFDQNNANKIQPPTIMISAGGGGATFGTALYGTDLFASAPDSDIRKQLVGSGFNASLQFEFLGDQPPFIIDTIVLEHSTEERR